MNSNFVNFRRFDDISYIKLKTSEFSQIYAFTRYTRYGLKIWSLPIFLKILYHQIPLLPKKGNILWNIILKVVKVYFCDIESLTSTKKIGNFQIFECIKIHPFLTFGFLIFAAETNQGRKLFNGRSYSRYLPSDS